MKQSFIFYILSLSIFLSGCFGANIYKKGSVNGYKDGVVLTHGGSFRVGQLASYWRERPINYRAVFFQNQNDASTITIDSWCKYAVDDSELDVLALQINRRLSDFKLIKQHFLPLAGREAIYSEVSGKMDGVQVYMSSYILKMNECVFDFIYVGYQADSPSHDDFNQMVRQFEFIKGPKIL